MAILTLVFGRDILQSYDINGNKTIIGRAEDCDIVVDNLGVSRHHAIVEKKDGTYQINDLDSNNGTFVNGRRITEPTSLNFGDEIGIGKHILIFDSHSKKQLPLDGPSLKEALPDMDSAGRGTMFVEPEKMEKIQKKVTATRRAHLRIINGNGQEDSLIPLDKAEFSFGKSDDCDIKIKGFLCSSHHAILSRAENGFQLINLSILRPVRINGIRVESAFLCDGDEVKMGKSTFIFHSNR